MKTGLNFYTTNIINSADQINAEYFKKFDGFEYSFITKAANDPVMEAYTLDLTKYIEKSDKAYYRIDMYITFDGSAVATGASPRDYNQGVPFWVEFTNSSTAAQIVSAINKTKAFVIDTPIIKASNEGAIITFTAKQEGVRFKKIEVLKFDNESEYAEFVIKGEKKTKGKNGFGTYSYLIKNATLPTLANTAWNSNTVMPIVGEKYDQYVVTMKAPSANCSMQHVGGRSTSETVHTFWVSSAAKEAFETELKKLGWTAPTSLED